MHGCGCVLVFGDVVTKRGFVVLKGDCMSLEGGVVDTLGGV